MPRSNLRKIKCPSRSRGIERSSMYRRICIYRLQDNDDLEAMLDCIRRWVSDSQTVRAYETGFDMETGAVSLIMDFDTAADCSGWLYSKEYINLCHEMPEAETSEIAYLR